MMRTTGKVFTVKNATTGSCQKLHNAIAAKVSVMNSPMTGIIFMVGENFFLWRIFMDIGFIENRNMAGILLSALNGLKRSNLNYKLLLLIHHCRRHHSPHNHYKRHRNHNDYTYTSLNSVPASLVQYVQTLFYPRT